MKSSPDRSHDPVACKWIKEAGEVLKAEAAQEEKVRLRFNQFIEFLTREQKVSLAEEQSFIEKTNKDFMNFFVYFTDPQHTKKALK